ncbi:MAG: Ig-like domain-containing protein [bacterium]|nr:Ig-like domain-containing protein [bacterium]MDY4098818.1 Ig-like domain-containing protein [Lachnospiraceae bacterium]
MKKKIAVRNRLFAWFLVLVMTLSMTPSDAFATEGNDTGTVMDESEEPAMDSDCTEKEEELPTPDDPLNESSEAENDENLEENPEEIPEVNPNENPNENTEEIAEELSQETLVKISENVNSLQEQINALPTGEEYRNMSADDQDAVYELAVSVSDAYFELSEEDQAKLDITRLEELFAVMNEGVETYDNTGAVTFCNSGYPYGKDMNSSNITLVIETESVAASYQWQKSDSKDGTFTDIAGATESTYKFTPTSGTWYRCVVDGTASEAVMAVKSGLDGRAWTKPYDSWYIGNGSMAYMANRTYFDAVGLYTKSGTDYMLCTSYGMKWDLFSNTSLVPNAGDTNAASLDALRVAFDASDAYNIIFEADLADGQQAFSFGCDTQLGNSNTSGNYSDWAALNAMVKNGVLQQVAMIGASTVSGAADTDPAFVIAPIDTASAFWIGRFSARKTYAYNTTGGTATETIGGQNVVTLLEGIDSGMTMSWMNIPSGGTVKFRFSVGDVAHTGAVSGKVDYEKETLTGLEPNTKYDIIAGGNTHTVTSDENGEIPLSGRDENGDPYDLTGKTLTIAKQGSDDTPAEIEVAGRPATPDKPSDLVDDEGETSTPIVDANIEIVELTTTSVTIAPREGQQYAYSTDGTNWTIITGTNEQGNQVITGLTEGTEVRIRTRLAATSSAPASQWSEPTQVTLKSTVHVTADGCNDTYDQTAHSISVNVTSPSEGAVISYSTAEDGGYSTDNPTFIDAGTYKVYYRVTAPDYYPAYGSATVKIDPKEVKLVWSDTKLTYNGEEQTPVATVKADSLYDGDSCTVIVEGGQTDHSDSAYTATATELSNPNYKLPADATQSFTIAKKKLKFKRWGSTSLTYNGNPQAPKAILEETVPGADLEVTGGRVNVGTGSAVVSLTSEASRNCDLEGDYPVEFEIFPKKITPAMVDADTSYPFTGSDITPVLSVTDGAIILSAQTDYILSGDVSGKAEGNYTVTVEGQGNYTGTVKIDYKITDSQPPTGTIKVSANEWRSFVNSLTFGIFYKERQTVTITAEDEGSGVDEVSYFLASFLTSGSEGMDQTALAALPASKWTKITNGGSFAINPDNKYAIYAKITDKSGNVTYLSTDGIVLDKTAPIITGIANNKTYCAGVTFAVTDAIGLKSVKIDDAEQGTVGSYTIAATGVKTNHTIVAEDVVGNKTTYMITINADGDHSFGEWVVTTPATCEEDGVESRMCSACGLVETLLENKKQHNYIIDSDHAHFVWTAKTEDGIVTGYNATVYFECENDPSHILDAGSCDVTREETVKPTQNAVGVVTYRASITYGDDIYSAQRTTTLAKLKELDSKDSSKSNIYTSTSVAKNAPATKLGSELDADLAKDLLTDAEKADYESTNVSTNVTVYLEVQNINDGVVAGDASKVEAQIADLATEKANTTSDVEVKTGAAYLDLSMYKNVKTEKKNDSGQVTSKDDITTQITDTGEEITITMDIPTGISTKTAGFTRTYHVIRVHDGKAEMLPTTQNGNQLTFKTSKFSTYAVTYVDVKDVSVYSPAESSGSGSMGIPVTKVTISSDKNSLTKKGDTLQLTVDVTPSNATDKKIKWSSSDPSIATVDENGKVTAVGNGTVTITAKTANGKTATFTIVVDLEVEKEEKSEEADNETNVTPSTTFHKLPLAEAKATKNAVKVSWKKVTGADGYVLYGAPCNTKDKTYKMKKLAVIKNGSKITYTDKKLKAGTYYKYYIKAYKLVNGKKVWLAQSKVIHVTTSGGKYGNAKAVKVNKTKVTLKKGKSLIIKASLIAESKPIKQHVNIKFESTNTKIATVSKNGRIKAKKKGTCYIYVYAQNGVYKRIKVVVS